MTDDPKESILYTEKSFAAVHDARSGNCATLDVTTGSQIVDLSQPGQLGDAVIRGFYFDFASFEVVFYKWTDDPADDTVDPDATSGPNRCFPLFPNSPVPRIPPPGCRYFVYRGSTGGTKLYITQTSREWPQWHRWR